MPARLNLRRPTVAVNAALAAALVAGGGWAYQILAGSAAAQGAAAAVRTVPVSQGTVTKTVTADGTVQSARTATADFVTGGRVTAISVHVGQLVKKGQVLAKVDPAAAQRSLDAADADRSAADAALSRAKAAGTDTSAAASAVAQAQVAVEQAQAAVDGCVLTAPMSGTVTAINGTLGGSSSGTGSAGSGTGGSGTGASGTGSAARSGGSGSGQNSTASASSSGFIALADLTSLQVSAGFAEADATKLKEKQAATVTWNALAGTRAPATLSAIDPSATTSNNVVTYGVTLHLGTVPSGARVGQTVTVSVTTGTVADAVYANSAAITTVGNRHTVTVLADGQRRLQPVETGLVGDTTTQITSGVQVGQQLVLPATATGTNTGNGFPGGGFGGPFGGPGGGGLRTGTRGIGRGQ
ncbi:efflux RND transporter periplasmic adaptor subunit [Krasilnikovia sp. MM14-A1259]|uniref:efflux RND transporter periplasmic adaptor subunit n=1 Tax=Krasilnikovia sp. MM14-A1259 TaxID=3373539 RepID=UPI00399CC270